MTHTELVDEIVQKIKENALPDFHDYLINNEKILGQV